LKNVLLAVALLAVSATTARAQNYPFPGSKSAAPVLCTNCPGTNSQSEPNKDKPTYPYDAPLLAHAGRLVDSSETRNYQNIGIRTVRAGRMRVVPSRNRIYVQLGEAVGAYALDTFFSGTLQEPMEPVSTINTGLDYYHRPQLEKVHDPDGFFYAESPYSGWSTFVLDGQKELHDFDADDRGYLYVATVHFGWGIARENVTTDGNHLPFVSNLRQMDPETIFAFRSGMVYYAAMGVSGWTGSGQLDLYDVTLPASPVKVVTRTGAHNTVRNWAKYEAGERLALIGYDGILRVHSYDGFAAGTAALATITPPTGKMFTDLSFDEAGNLWFVEGSPSPSTITTNSLWKLAPAGTGYTSTSFVIEGGAFRPTVLHVGAGYAAIAGRDTAGNNLRLFRIGTAGPELIATDDFFRKYYAVSPAGYAVPNWRYSVPYALQLLQQGDATYLIYNGNSLGDAFRISTPASSITSIEPASGPPSGGTVVTLGTVNVTGDVSVTFGDVAATNTTVVMGRITTTAPPRAPGSVDVKVVANGVTLTAPQQFTYVLETPTNFNAAAASTTSVAVTWDAVAGATQYELSRRNPDGTWTPLATAPSRSFNDSGRTAGSGYAYRVRAVDGDGHASGYAHDVATTVTFSTHSIARGMVIRRAHMSELRHAADALRASAGLSPFGFDETKFFRAADLNALRLAVTQARTALGLPTPTFTDSASPSGSIKAVHFQELLNAVR
jgi:hypothetical protein